MPNALPELIVSEPDLTAALGHLRSFEFDPPLKQQWGRTRLIQALRKAIGKDPSVGTVSLVAPGILAQVQPFGVDLPGGPAHERFLQVLLFIRPTVTDPSRIVAL